MNTPSERIPLVGLTLADGHAISDQLRARSMYLRDLSCAALAMGEDAAALNAEREHVLLLRDAVIQATTGTLAGLS
jgi:hypothetical protein